MMASPGSEIVEADADQRVSDGRQHELAGKVTEAMECYATAIELAGGDQAARTRSDALRRLGVLHHLRGEPQVARDLCEQSYEVALQAEANDLAVEALNALAGFDFEHGLMPQALRRYSHALELAAKNPALIAKIQHNLGILASVRGDWGAAADHYARSLATCEQAQDQRGCAFAYHNLGRLHADQKQWTEADRCFRASQRLAEALGDRHLSSLASLNQADVYLALEQYEPARRCAEAALGAFSQLDGRRDRAGAHRILGVIFRETNRPTLAESHLRSSLEMARAADCPLLVADALRELAKLYGKSGRKGDALARLGEARELYSRLDARQDLVETATEEQELQLA